MASQKQIKDFQELVWNYYRDHARQMPWRDNPTPYWVVVSEVMLQQTQVPRVLVKFEQFITTFPTFEALAAAPSSAVVVAWQGLGYNRRALNLQRLAATVVNDYGGELPSDPAVLIKLPGIGPGTAGSIAAFAFDAPVVFIETNIRRVFIHHFFADQEKVSDKEIEPLVAAALDREQPRQWYYALMDYGTALAKSVPNPNRQSKHYTRQSKFEGSPRQIRGAVLRALAGEPLDEAALRQALPAPTDERIDTVLAELTKEGFITLAQGKYRLL